MQDFLILLFSQLINWIGGNLVTSLLTGLVTGVTASIVVARLAKFEELRNEARRIVWGIDWIIENGSHKFKADSRISNLLYISSEFFALKHKEAGEAIAQLLQEINSTFYSHLKNEDQIQDQYSNWQRICRELKPNRTVIFQISWKL